MHIIGTAGHVDHGKSSLVRALTGIDPDRWAEEQRRGMTLDLGFARLAFADGGEAGIIDVPGHERFLHNMLAGAAGMEIVLLVVAANEGVKPQTLEHLAILRYLNVRQTLIVLSKIDTVEAERVGPAGEALRDALAGTIAHDAPLFPVSTTDGRGLAALRSALHVALAALPERAPDAPPYLPIDRVFALAGHGTIVTGTLMQGRIAVGDALTLSPAGREVRVRSIQVFGEKRERVTGGTRVALNLPGIERGAIARGAVLAGPQFPLSHTVAMTFAVLPSARNLLRRRMPVRAYIGSAEILATLVLERFPGDSAAVDAQLHLRLPTVAVPGAPVVLRRVSPMDVLGGGTIVGVSTLPADSEAALAPAGRPAEPPEHRMILAAVRDTGLRGATPMQIGARTNIAEERVTAMLETFARDGRVITVPKPPAYVAADIGEELVARAVERLALRERERPWLIGMTSIALAQALAVPEGELVRVLTAYVEAGRIRYRAGYYATPDFRPHITAEQRAFFDTAFGIEPGGQPGPVAFEELQARMRAAAVRELPAAFETLLADGALAKVGDLVYRGNHVAKIRAQLETALIANGQITVAQFRDLTGTSRKYAVPLLEFFDARGVTIRSGDIRVLRRPVTSRR